MKVCSAGSKEKLLEMINAFYYSSNYVIQENNEVFNTKLNKVLGYVESKKGRFTYIAK